MNQEFSTKLSQNHTHFLKSKSFDPCSCFALEYIHLFLFIQTIIKYQGFQIWKTITLNASRVVCLLLPQLRVFARCFGRANRQVPSEQEQELHRILFLPLDFKRFAFRLASVEFWTSRILLRC